MTFCERWVKANPDRAARLIEEAIFFNASLLKHNLAAAEAICDSVLELSQRKQISRVRVANVIFRHLISGKAKR